MHELPTLAQLAWDEPELDYAGESLVRARALDRIAKTGVAMELNTSGLQKAISEINPSPTMLGMMRERGIPVVLGSDAHVAHRVGDGYANALRTLQGVGYTEINFFLERKRQTVPITAALASLK